MLNTTICVRRQGELQAARKKGGKIAPREVKKTGRTFRNSMARTIDTQSYIARRFKKAARNPEPFVLAQGKFAQKIEKTKGEYELEESDIVATKNQKVWRPRTRILAAKDMLSLRPAQPLKFFGLANFAEQCQDNVVKAHAKYWSDNKFFYVNSKIFKPKNSWAVLNSFFSDLLY